MDQIEFRKEQFVALRREVEGQQWRSFLTVIIGLMGLPALSYFLLEAASRMWLVLPLLVLVLIMLYIMQQSEMMRAGRYIREQLEHGGELGLGWETWLESKPEFRAMESRFSGCFIVIFFLYYALAVGVALYRLILEAADDPSGTYWMYVYGALSGYAVLTVWALMTVLSHWRSAVGTTPSKG